MCLENDKYGLSFSQPSAKVFTLWHLGFGTFSHF